MMNGTDRHEEKQAFMSLLPETLETLCGTCAAPHDDTILHRLLDTIKQLVTTPDDAQSCGLFTFVNTVKEKTSELSSPVLVLALGVAAHLVSIATLPDEDWESVRLIFEAVQSTLVTEDSSVGAAYYNSLASVACCTKGLLWLEKTNLHAQAALSTLETAQSVFLLKAAENYLLTSLKKSLQTNSTTPMQVPPSSTVVVDTVQILVSELAEIGTSRTSLMDQMIVSTHTSAFHQSVAQLIAMLCECREFCEWKASDNKLLHTLAHLALRHTSAKIQLCALQSVVRLAGGMKDESKEELLTTQVIRPLLKLVSEGAISTGVSVAAAFIHSSLAAATSESLSTLQLLHQLPHDILFGRHIHHPELTSLVSSVTASLCDQHQFSRIIVSLMHSVKQTCNSDGLVRLMQTAGSSKVDTDWLSYLSSWPQGMGAVVAGNQKLLNSLLHMLQEEDCPELSMHQCTAVLLSLTHIMKRPMVESRLYTQTCSAFLSILRRQYQLLDPEETVKMQEVLGCLAALLANRLVTLQWEIRDTSLELIRNVISVVSDAWFCNVLLEHHILCLSWRCTKDNESYPRASAISLVTSLAGRPDWWAALLQDANITEASLVDEMMEVLASDTEAFPRRASVLFLTAFFSHHHLLHSAHSPSSVSSDTTKQRQQMCSALTLAMSDFDWEVKVKVLEFWEMVAAPLLCEGQSCRNDHNQSIKTNENGSCQNGAARASGSVPHKERSESRKHKCEQTNEEECQDKLDHLLRDGFGEALIVGSEDYDTAVKRKSLHMLATVQDIVKIDDQVPAKSQKLDSESGTIAEDREDKNANSGNVSAPIPSSEVLQLSVDKFMLRVSQLDPASQVKRLGASSDEYDRKPVSLLEDVQAAARTAAPTHDVTFMSEDEFDDADDMFVDCY